MGNRAKFWLAAPYLTEPLVRAAMASRIGSGARFDALDLLADETLGGARHNLGGKLTNCVIAHLLDDPADDALDNRVVIARRWLEGGGRQLALFDR